MFIAGAGAVGRVGRPGLSGNGARRPSFDIDFVGSGSLGAGAVFTRASTGTYYNSSGVLVSAAINTPRFDYDPVTLQLKGLLLEDASTNLLPWSQDVSNGVWFKQGAVVVSNTVAAPDGTNTGQTISVALNGAGPAFGQQLAGVTGTRYEPSFWINRISTTGTLKVSNAVNSANGDWSVNMALIGPGWQRITRNHPAVTILVEFTGVTNQTGIFIYTTGAVVNASWWGFQLEALPYVSSYIPTTSVSVTRAQDVLFCPSAALTGFKTTGGSWFAEFDYIKNPLTNSRVIGFGVGGGGVTPLFMRDTNAGSQFDGGLLDTATTTTPNVINKIASTWTAGQAKTVLNAGPVASSASLTVGYGSFATTGINVFTPQGPGGFDNLAGHIRRLSYWPRVLSDSEMQAATTLAGPTLSLDFMQPGTLDPRITFTRASSATYTDASGVIQTAATNAPRWDYAGGVLRGLSVEEQRTNVALQSSMGTTWAAYGTGSAAPPTATPNAVLAPDGSVTGTRLVYSAVSGPDISIWYQNVTTAVAVYTFSLWLRGAVGGEQIYFSVNNDGTGFSRSPRLTLTTQWQRFALTTSSLTVAGWTFEVGTDLRDASQTATPAQTVYAWGAQVEQGAFPTSYIPTTSVSVTRAADVASISSANMSPWFASPGGSWFAEFIQNSPSNNARIIGVNGGGGGQSPLYITGGSQLGQYDGVTLTNTANVITLGTIRKGASSSAPSVLKECLDGGAVVSVATTGNYAALGTNGIIVFFNEGMTFATSGYIRRVNYWNRALSDTEMQQVTT